MLSGYVFRTSASCLSRPPTRSLFSTLARGAGFTIRSDRMPVMTKTPKGDDIVILARKEYDQLIAVAGEDAADAEAARRALDRRKKGEHSLTSAEMDDLLAAKTPLAFYRK